MVADFFDAHEDWLPAAASTIQVPWDGIVAQMLERLLELELASGVLIRLLEIKARGQRLVVSVDATEHFSPAEGHLPTSRENRPLECVERDIDQIVDRAVKQASGTCPDCGPQRS